MQQSANTTQLIELRRYLLRPGQREALIELFDCEFVETQEAVGMAVLGQFRDPQRPDHFVWLRGFPDMATRHASLAAFYDGHVWAKHRDAANATMIDSDDVLLLRPATANDQLPTHAPAKRGTHPARGPVAIVVDYVEDINDDAVERFRSEVPPAFVHAGFRQLGLYTTTIEPNSFTRLPIRNDPAIVWIGATDEAFDDLAAIPSHGHRRQDRHLLIPTTRSNLDATSTGHAQASQEIHPIGNDEKARKK